MVMVVDIETRTGSIQDIDIEAHVITDFQKMKHWEILLRVSGAKSVNDYIVTKRAKYRNSDIVQLDDYEKQVDVSVIDN